MRVLYAVSEYPYVNGSYIEAEVRATAAWGPREWRAVERRAAAFAARHYSSRVLAPKLVAAWRRVLRERKAAPPLGVSAL